jgi:hypothetical protein
MVDHNDDHKMDTHHLGQQGAELMPERITNPLDSIIPRAIRFRIVDTPDVIETPLQGFVVLGRKDQPGFGQADVDFTRFNAQESGVSRRHAVISVQDQRVLIKDLNSMNGTFLNGYALQPLHSYRLRNGDELRLGKLIMQVGFVEVPASAQNG